MASSKNNKLFEKNLKIRTHKHNPLNVNDWMNESKYKRNTHKYYKNNNSNKQKKKREREKISSIWFEIIDKLDRVLVFCSIFIELN